MTRPMLDGPMLPPASGRKAQQIVVLLHGYGSNGADLIGLAPHWRRVLPDALFIAPNAPERCPGSGGYQWWGLSSLARADLAAGARRAAPALDAFLDALLEQHGLIEERLLLVGFSQGTMMALHVGPRRERALAGIIGFSGMMAAPGSLARDLKTRPPVLLVHGGADPVVPVAGSREARDELHALGFDISSHVSPGLGHSVDAIGLQLGETFAKRVLLGAQAE